MTIKLPEFYDEMAPVYAELIHDATQAKKVKVLTFCYGDGEHKVRARVDGKTALYVFDGDYFLI